MSTASMPPVALLLLVERSGLPPSNSIEITTSSTQMVLLLLDPQDLLKRSPLRTYYKLVSYSILHLQFFGSNSSFRFPWVQSVSLNTIVWSTPNVPASVAITQVIYDPIDDSWSIVVSSALNWPYMLTKPDSTSTINGMFSPYISHIIFSF